MELLTGAGSDVQKFLGRGLPMRGVKSALGGAGLSIQPIAGRIRADRAQAVLGSEGVEEQLVESNEQVLAERHCGQETDR